MLSFLLGSQIQESEQAKKTQKESADNQNYDVVNLLPLGGNLYAIFDVLVWRPIRTETAKRSCFKINV